MRAAFAEAAFLSNAERWLAGQVRGKPRTILLEYQKIKHARGLSLTKLQEWIGTVQRRTLDEVETMYWTERLPIGIAVCGTSTRRGFYSAPTINIMPRIDGKTDILISTRYNGTEERSASDVAEVERLGDVIKSIKSNPATGIEALIRTVDQVFLNPEEYNDDSIMTDRERTSLREGIARYRAEAYQGANLPANVPLGTRT